MNESLKESQEKFNKQFKERNTDIKNLKMEIKIIKKTETDGFLEMKNLGK